MIFVRFESFYDKGNRVPPREIKLHLIPCIINVRNIEKTLLFQVLFNTIQNGDESYDSTMCSDTCVLFAECKYSYSDNVDVRWFAACETKNVKLSNVKVLF